MHKHIKNYKGTPKGGFVSWKKFLHTSLQKENQEVLNNFLVPLLCQ